MNFYRRVFWEWEIGRGVYKKVDGSESEKEYYGYGDETKHWELEVPRRRGGGGGSSGIIGSAPRSADPRSGGFFNPLSPRRTASYHHRSQSSEVRPSNERRGVSAGTSPGGRGMGLGISSSPFLHPP